MMTKIKCELDKELEICASSSNDNSNSNNINEKREQNEAHLISQIKHLEEQMKGVVFLLMQCQIGLETCGDQHQIKIFLSNDNEKTSLNEQDIDNLHNCDNILKKENESD